MPATKPTPEPNSAPAVPADETPKRNAGPAPESATSEATAADEVPPGRLAAGVYEFTGSIPTLYLDVPLTAHPAYPEQPATGDTEPVPARPATVYAWPFGAPADGRWQPTKKKPNQVADNAAAPSPTED